MQPKQTTGAEAADGGNFQVQRQQQEQPELQQEELQQKMQQQFVQKYKLEHL